MATDAEIAEAARRYYRMARRHEETSMANGYDSDDIAQAVEDDVDDLGIRLEHLVLGDES